MCAPSVIASVHAEWSRRHFFGALVVGAAGAAVAACDSASPPPPPGAAAAPAGTTGTNSQGGPMVQLPNGFREVFDLTHLLSPATPVYPAFKPMRYQPLFSIEKDGFTCGELTFNEHTGTHMDAPIHFVAGGVTVDRLPAERLFAPLAVISIKDRVDRNPDTGVTVDDILGWEKQHGRLPSRAFVAMHSGWDARIGDARAFLNIDPSGTAHTPGFTGEAAEFLVFERDIVGVGVDTVSLDMGTSTTPTAHLAILGAGKYGIEVAANLASVPPVGAMVIVGAPKHKDGTGGPVRLLAVA
jgi:kynurenine formamidase